ncbi:EexN family lipoprotein [Pseudomonas frederiksbergensis]|uniref:Conjugal transfer protein TraG n=1 Tax=Pseudomonas frederiksbergensis TaxID=104087 RepID=A0A0B1Z2L5_9PSED|nr:EexN family lipoprotein [Pseudomonas frederiksbergensis]KHK65304.1 conjugal transfer protein TraG [Pseudomonas frederiksbergensis]
MKKLSFVLAVTVILAGCGESTPVQTVDWYKNHDAERKGMIVKCEENPGELAATPNCINAKTAANHLAVDKRDYPKLVPSNPLKGG